VNPDWSLLDSAMPLAPLVGPFVRSPFLSLLERHSANPKAIRHIVGTRSGAVAFERLDEGLTLSGPENLVDYRSPVGNVSSSLVEMFEQTHSGTAIRLDSLPIEAVGVFVRALGSVGIDAEPKEHESAAVLHLPATFDDYMAAIGKKERHEIRRKGRRLSEESGELAVVSSDLPGPALVDFFRLHQQAAGNKGTFMTSQMVAFFSELLKMPGWQLDALRGGQGQMLAAVFGYTDSDGFYLYNSAYETRLHRLAPGLVLLNRLIERSIDAGHHVFDFLKGDETYKYRMGAEPRPLFEMEVVL